MYQSIKNERAHATKRHLDRSYLVRTVRSVGNVCAMYDSFSWNENDDPALGNVNINIYIYVYVWFSIGVRGSAALPNECVPVRMMKMYLAVET